MAPRNYGSSGDSGPLPDDVTLEPSSSNESEPLVVTSGFGGGGGTATNTKLLERKDPKTMKRIAYAITVGVVLAVGVTFFGKNGKNGDGIHAWTSGGGSTSSSSASSAAVMKKNQRIPSSDTVLSTETLISPEDLEFITVERMMEQSPGPAWGQKLLDSGKPLPTNSWYLNLLSHNAGSDHPSEATRVYTVPYIIDTAGPIPGIRIHWPTLKAGVRNMQMVVNSANGLTLGTATPPGENTSSTSIGRKYTLAEDELSMLGVSLQWKGAAAAADIKSSSQNDSLRRSLAASSSGDPDSMMTTHLVRGMPYTTMEYSGKKSFPSITSGGRLASPPIIDGTTELSCGEMQNSMFSPNTASETATSEVLLHFESSDFTWLVLFSKPVKISCYEVPEMKGQVGLLLDVMFQLFVTPISNEEEDENSPLIVRVALADECTTGKSNVAEHCDERRKMKDADKYLDLLRDNVNLYPKSPILSIDMSKEDADETEARYTFDWDVHSFPNGDSIGSVNEGNDSGTKKELLMFALPHHQDILESIEGVSTNQVLENYCKPTFHGSTCLVRGNKWSLVEKLGERQSFIANRPPEAFAIPDLVQALSKDIKYELSDNLHRAAADTYFSGKILARMGRVLLIAKELQDLADGVRPQIGNYGDDLDEEWYTSSSEAAKNAVLPSKDEFDAALEELKKGVEIWINGQGEAQYLYDATWGGLVNCGCRYTSADAYGFCNNTYPDCPALIDVNVNFGNGFYNDHHFHYGYNIYAAAVAAKLDPAWGRKMFDRVMLYVRDIANPAPNDPYFPQYRQKDWFLGSSWASGIISMDTPHGRNQESSSEAIAAYEGVALFGAAMAEAFKETSEKERVQDAERVRASGRLLAAMEVSATQRYWHVWNSTSHKNTYPEIYTQPVVGMLYETMASFQTWFDGGDMASIGIQLLPFTPISERRDDPEWAALVYPPYEESCKSNYDFCVKNGWSVMLSGLKATIGDRIGALKDALDIPKTVFDSEGGNGHTRSNLIWYVSTRPDVDLKTGAIEAIAEEGDTLNDPETVETSP